MLKFVRSGYRICLEILLWINVIVWAIVGYHTGAAMRYFETFGENAPMIGLISGLCVGVFISVIVFGLIATILNIDKSLDVMNENLELLTSVCHSIKKAVGENSATGTAPFPVVPNEPNRANNVWGGYAPPDNRYQ